MPAPPAKSRRSRRRGPAQYRSHDAEPLPRLFVQCDEHGKPICADDGRPIFWVADEEGRLRRLASPPNTVGGRFRLGDGDGPPADLPPALPITEPPRPRRGRPRKRVPLRDWENENDPLEAIKQIVRKDRRTRADDATDAGSEMLADLHRFAAHRLGQPLSATQKEELRTLLFGGTYKIAEKASVIRDYLLACQHGLGDRDLRRLKKIGRLVSR